MLQTYNVHFENDTDQNKTVKFYLHSPSQVFVRYRNVIDGSEASGRLKDFGDYIPPKEDEKDGHYESKDEGMVEMYVPNNGETVEYEISVIHVTGNDGSIRNYFEIVD